MSKAKLGEGPARLLGAFVLSAFMQAGESRAEIAEEDRRDFSVYCEEYQDYGTRAVLGAITQSRAWRLSWVLSHQLLAQLPASLSHSVIGTVGSDRGVPHGRT